MMVAERKKPLKVTLKWSFLERIAEFYEFPSAVFLAPKSIFPKGTTRNKSIVRKAELYDKIKDIFEV